MPLATSWNQLKYFLEGFIKGRRGSLYANKCDVFWTWKLKYLVDISVRTDLRVMSQTGSSVRSQRRSASSLSASSARFDAFALGLSGADNRQPVVIEIGSKLTKCFLLSFHYIFFVHSCIERSFIEGVTHSTNYAAQCPICLKVFEGRGWLLMEKVKLNSMARSTCRFTKWLHRNRRFRFDKLLYNTRSTLNSFGYTDLQRKVITLEKHICSMYPPKQVTALNCPSRFRRTIPKWSHYGIFLPH